MSLSLLFMFTAFPLEDTYLNNYLAVKAYHLALSKIGWLGSDYYYALGTQWNLKFKGDPATFIQADSFAKVMENLKKDVTHFVDISSTKTRYRRYSRALPGECQNKFVVIGHILSISRTKNATTVFLSFERVS